MRGLWGLWGLGCWVCGVCGFCGGSGVSGGSKVFGVLGFSERSWDPVAPMRPKSTTKNLKNKKTKTMFFVCFSTQEAKGLLKPMFVFLFVWLGQTKHIQKTKEHVGKTLDYSPSRVYINFRFTP